MQHARADSEPPAETRCHADEPRTLETLQGRQPDREVDGFCELYVFSILMHAFICAGFSSTFYISSNESRFFNIHITAEALSINVERTAAQVSLVSYYRSSMSSRYDRCRMIQESILAEVGMHIYLAEMNGLFIHLDNRRRTWLAI